MKSSIKLPNTNTNKKDMLKVDFAFTIKLSKLLELVDKNNQLKNINDIPKDAFLSDKEITALFKSYEEDKYPTLSHRNN